MLSQTLQDVHTDIGSAVKSVEGIKAELEEWLTDAGKINSKWEAVWDQAIEACNRAEVPEPVEHRQRRAIRADFLDSKNYNKFRIPNTWMESNRSKSY